VDPEHDKLVFQVFDHNRVTRDDFLGMVDLPLKGLQIPGPDGQMKQENFSLKPRTNRSKVSGSLSVKLQYLYIPLPYVVSRPVRR
jgi:hypothetical protein